MNENLNLSEILKGHEGEKFYNPLLGNIELAYITDEYIVFSYNLGCDELFIKHNGNSKDTDEPAVFPSKGQRDWSKWFEEQKPKVPKTWDEFLLINKDYESYLLVRGIYLKISESSPIEKSALALLKINQLIEAGYGGNITNEEWTHGTPKYTIMWLSWQDSVRTSGFVVRTTFNKTPIAFHTQEQAEEFLKYPENVQLLKDYSML